MTYRVICPACKAELFVPELMRGMEIQCQHCAEMVQTGAAQAVPASPAAQPVPKRPPARTEPETPPPAKVQRKSSLQASPPARAQRPAPKTRNTTARTSRTDPDDEEAPLIRSPLGHRRTSSPAKWWVLGILGALLLFGGGVGLAFLTHDGKEQEKQVVQKDETKP